MNIIIISILNIQNIAFMAIYSLSIPIYLWKRHRSIYMNEIEIIFFKNYCLLKKLLYTIILFIL